MFNPQQMPLASDDNSQEMAGSTKGYQYILYHVYVLYTALCVLYPVYSIQYTVYYLTVRIGLYTFSTYVRMAPPRLEKQQYIHLHALQGQGCHHLMLLSYAGMLLIILLSRPT
jgi:hypothetical protein